MENSKKPVHFFLHLPKCAGTTVIRSLCRVGRRKRLIISGSPKSKSCSLAELKSQLRRRSQCPDDLDVVMGHDVFLGMETLLSRPVRFVTFLRDPVSRYLSHYRYFVDCSRNCRSDIHEFAKRIITENGRTLERSEVVAQRRFRSVMTNYLASAADPDLSTKRWSIKEPARLLELAKTCLDKMSYIGFVEDFDEDLSRHCREVGVRPRRAAVNRSVHKLACQLPEGLLQEIRELNRLDVRIYEYAARLKRHAIASMVERESG